jgi:hypothetical protein
VKVVSCFISSGGFAAKNPERTFQDFLVAPGMTAARNSSAECGSTMERSANNHEKS